jgi:hypothetical protein
MPSSVTINTAVDIVIGEKSFQEFKKRKKAQYKNTSEGLYSVEIDEYLWSLLGTCETGITIDCESIIRDLFDRENIPLSGMRPDKPEGFDDLCDFLSLMKNTQLDYYLIYKINSKPNSLVSFGDDAISGSIEFSYIKPVPAETKGGAEQPYIKYCDECKGNFNDYEYGMETDEEFNDIIADAKIDRSIIINSVDWTNKGFGANNPVRDIDNNPVKFSPPDFDPTKNQGTVLSKTNQGLYPTARYDGFNHWAYSKYYGGTDYEIITEPISGEPRLAKNLGKAFSVSVKVRKTPNKENIISFTINPTSEFDIYSKLTNKKWYKVKKAPGAAVFEKNNLIVKTINKTIDGKFYEITTEIPIYIDKSEFDSVMGGPKIRSVRSKSAGGTGPSLEWTDELPFPVGRERYPTWKDLEKEGIIELEKEGDSNKTYEPREEKNKSITIECCPFITPVKVYELQIVKETLSSGQKRNVSITIEQAKILAAGRYTKEAAELAEQAECCKECSCLLGDFCPGVNEVIRQIQNTEIRIRDHEAKPFGGKTAKDAGPQCVFYDNGSGWPVPPEYVRRTVE